MFLLTIILVLRGYSFSVNDNVKIYKTTDGGATWDSIDSKTSYLFNIYFINPSTGWQTVVTLLYHSLYDY